MRKCPCPVWVTKAHDRDYKGILAAIDPMHEGAAAAKLNRTILDLAASLARLGDGTLHIVHCWQLVGVEAEAYRPEVPPEVLDRLRGSERERRQQEIRELLSSQDLIGIPYRLHLIEGQPGQVIPELARHESIELVVMGTVCRTGIAGFFVGNTAEAVLPEIDCALLTVKPPGFISPVFDRSGLPVRETVEA